MKGSKHIVVIGGGFAGLNLIKHIDKRRYRITLIDKNNFHSFPPLFYQIASSGLEPGSICFPLRRELRKGKGAGVEYRMGEVKVIDCIGRKITTQYETIDYDYLVIACGTTNNFFGNDNLIHSVYTIKSVSEAMRTRNEILFRLEKASLCSDERLRRKMLSFVVVGGGPSGVEVAGALGEMKRYVIKREYPNISPDDISITLLEGSDRLLSSMSLKSQNEAKSYLNKLMVNVRLNHLLKSYSDGEITLNDGTKIEAGMVIWTAGVSGVEIPVSGCDLGRERNGRIPVDRFNRSLANENIFAIGDISIMRTCDFPDGHPQLAQVALQQSKNLARNLNHEAFDSEFRYKDRGSMATVGRNLAVADLRHIHFSGFPAWAIWMFIHLISILGMRNKLSVLIDWIWAYFSYGTSLRLLLRMSKEPVDNN